MCENATTRDQRILIMSAFNPAAILLSKDVNGHRVALSCLRNFPHEDTKVKCVFLFLVCYIHILDSRR